MADVTNSKLFHTGAGILKKDACIVLVKTEWNAAITDELEKGAIEELRKQHVKTIISITVPGAVEIPFAIKSYWDSKMASIGQDIPDAFIALACVIKGDTPHFDYVCRIVADGVTQLNLMLPVPTIFGVLTVDNNQHAEERIGGKHGHKGQEAAITAIKMIALKESFSSKARD